MTSFRSTAGKTPALVLSAGSCCSSKIAGETVVANGGCSEAQRLGLWCRLVTMINQGPGYARLLVLRQH